MTLTLDRVIRHTVVHHSSTSTYIPNFIKIGKTFSGRMDGHLTHIIRSTLRSRPKKGKENWIYIAPHCEKLAFEALRHGSHSFLRCNYTTPAFTLLIIHQTALP